MNGKNKRNYTFKNFIADSSNHLALFACKGIADNQFNFNPLIIYGNTGCGKTHLLMAIKEKMESEHKKIRVGYFTVEEIVFMYISSITKREKVKSVMGLECDKCDVVLLDGIETLQGKESTQKEFFKLINRLTARRKQVVITCSTNPINFPFLTHKLMTQQKNSMFCNIMEPSLNLRQIYAQHMAMKTGVSINEKEAKHIALTHVRLSTIKAEILKKKIILDNKENY